VYSHDTIIGTGRRAGFVLNLWIISIVTLLVSGICFLALRRFPQARSAAADNFWSCIFGSLVSWAIPFAIASDFGLESLAISLPVNLAFIGISASLLWAVKSWSAWAARKS
jgi:heme/copper-type cytochrome/quinol oxidase subunit 2